MIFYTNYCVLSFTFFFSLLLKLVNSQIVPVGSTIYYSATRKCIIYGINSEICIDGEQLKSINENNDENNDVIETINNSGKNYYEINLFTQTDTNYINCMITYFENKNQLIFKYYQININNHNDYNKTDYKYYNESLNPFNKGINCQVGDFNKKFICFYMNKNKEVIQMDIKHIDNSYNVTIEFQVGKIEDFNALKGNDTLIMSSLLMGKYKFFYPNGNFDFSIYVKEATEFDFSSGSVNNIRQFEYHKDDNNYNNLYFTFAIFKEKISNEFSNIQPKKVVFFILKNENPNVIETYGDNFHHLIFENKTNILFLKIKEGIKDFEFEETESSEIINIFNESNNSNIISSDIGKEIKKINVINENTKKEEILNNIEKIMREIQLGETYEYKNNDFNLLIYPINSKLLKNKTHIDSFQCESDLKNYYNLSNESIITFFQMEISNGNEKSLINQVEYLVYDEEKNCLDLSKCNNSNIKILYGIKTNSNLDMSVLNSFIDSEVNVFNISDNFFNDICYPYSENGNDLILEDRIKDIYQDFTLCEEGCYFDKIDINNMLISCQCNIKENITTEIKEINDEKVIEKITSLNFEIIRCYNLAFSFKGKKKNYGFWILSIFFLFYFIFLISFSCKGIKPIKDYIFNLIKIN